METTYKLSYSAIKVLDVCLNLLQNTPETSNLMFLPDIWTIYVDLVNYPKTNRAVSLLIKLESISEQSCHITLIIESSLSVVHGTGTTGKGLLTMTYFMHHLLEELKKT